MRIVLAAVAALVVLVGCGGSHGHVATARAVASRATTTATPGPITEHRTAMTADTYRVVASLAGTWKGEDVVYGGLVDDRHAVGYLNSSAGRVDGIVVTDVRTGEVRQVWASQPGDFGIGASDARDGWILWWNEPGKSWDALWQLWSYDVRTGRVHRLDSPPLTERTRITGQEVPAIAGDRALVSYPTTPHSTDSHSLVVSVPLDGSGPTRTIEHGSDVVAATRGTIYAVPHEHVVRLVGATWQDVMAGCQGDGEKCAWAVGDGAYAWTSGRTRGSVGELIRVVDEAGRTTIVDPLSSDVEGLQVSSRWVTYEDGGDHYVVDLARRTVRRTPEGTHLLESTVDRDELLWWHRDADGHRTYDLVRLR